MGKQRILHKDELDDILDHYTNGELSYEEMGIFSEHDVPLLIQQIELLHEYLRELIDGVDKVMGEIKK